MNEGMTRQMPKGYAALWGGITLAYVIWLVFFLRDTMLVKYETVAERTVDGYLYADITGMTGHHWLFPVWVVLSALSLLLYIVYIKKILYAERLGGGAKWFCLTTGVLAFIYVRAFAFLDAPNRAGEVATLSDKIHYVTASMIGLQWPWLFKLWGILTGTALFTNTLYAFRRFGYDSRVAVVLGSVGTAAIYLSLNCPSLGETKDFSDPRCVAHWLGALIFAFLIAAPVVMFLYHMAHTEKGLFRPTFYGFVAILLLMIILLVTVGKSALIENLPIVAAYLILLAMNFTNLYEKPSS